MLYFVYQGPGIAILHGRRGGESGPFVLMNTAGVGGPPQALLKATSELKTMYSKTCAFVGLKSEGRPHFCPKNFLLNPKFRGFK